MRLSNGVERPERLSGQTREKNMSDWGRISRNNSPASNCEGPEGVLR
jgi:hypothetical protein